jgi:hypothetical protein
MKTEKFNDVYLEFDEQAVDASEFETQAINTIVNDLKMKELKEFTDKLAEIVETN